MYTEEYEKRGFPIKSFLAKLILVVIFVLLLVWLLPKFITPSIKTESQQRCNGSTTCDLSGLDALTSQIFSDNLERMKDAAITYYTADRLPTEVGASQQMSLSDMIGKKLIVPLIDKNNKAVDVEKSYVKITKMNDEYLLKVNIKDSEKEDYILVHLGCYSYCDSYICQKQTTTKTTTGTKSGKVNPVVPITPIVSPSPVQPSPTAIITPTCLEVNGKFYDKYGSRVSEVEYYKSCHAPKCQIINGYYFGKDGNSVTKSKYTKECTVQPVVHTCTKYNGQFYDKSGRVVSEVNYIISCQAPKCEIVNGYYFGKNGDNVSKANYDKQCGTPEPTYTCTYRNGKYYDKKGNVVSEVNYIISCQAPKCKIVNGYYFGKNGTNVSKATYEKECTSQPPVTHTCTYYNGHYYDKSGNIVSEVNYIISCQAPKCKIVNGYYFGKNGNNVNKATYEKECTSQPVEWIYEYKKTTSARFSEWTKWSSWAKADCSTKEVNCTDTDTSCLYKLQMLKRKEKIGTYQKTYAKKRQVVKQTGSYEVKSCANYNYVKIDKTLYVTTTSTTYTTVNTITTTTTHSTGGWTYNGRASYSNPPRDTGSTHYQFVGADYSYCGDTCTTLPNYYYDSYSYTGGLASVSSTTSSTTTAGTPISETHVAGQTTSYAATCGSIVTKTIPIYGTITVTEKASRTEPLYGDVCYKSTKSRTLVDPGTTQYKWSSYNDTSLLNNGWVYTGNKKQK